MSAKAKVEHYLSLNMPNQAEAVLHKAASSFEVNELYTLLARTQFMRGNSKHARLSAQKSTRHTPESSEAWRVRALPEIAARQTDVARTYLRRAILLDPGHVSAYATSTIQNRSANEPSAAEISSRRAELLDPYSDEALRSKASLLFTVGKIDEAYTVNRRAILLAPNVGRPYFLSALMEKALTRPWNESARRSLAIQPTDDGPRMLVVEKLAAARDPEPAAREIRRVVLSNPDTPVGYVYLAAGSEWVAQKTSPRKLISWLQPLELDAQRCGRQLAVRIANMGYEAQAVELLEYLVAKDPASREAKFALGGCLRKFERFTEAERIARKLINSEKADTRGWILLVEVLQQQGFYDAAERIIKGGLRYTNKNYSLWSLYGNLLLKQERYGRAVKILQRALIAAPTLPQAYEQLAGVYDILTKEVVATKLYARGMRFKGKSSRGLAALSSMALQSGDEVLALKYAQEALDLDPTDERAISAHVTVLIATDDYGGALHAASMQLQRVPDKASAISLYAMTLARSGQLKTAVDLLQAKLADAFPG